MDYSTISNKTTFTEAEDLTNGELSERYYLLKKQFDNVSASLEATKQELHDTRRSYQTALDVQAHLTAELEGYQADERRRQNDLNSRMTSLQDEISALREERTELTERHASEVNKMQSEIRYLKEENESKPDRVTPDCDSGELDEVRAALSTALSDVMSAKAALDEARSETVAWRMKTEELVAEMGEIRAAAELRREELKAAAEREAVALAELAEAKAMLHQCTDSQDLQPHAAKGNSIFAEVEDKRQEMAKNLIQMKQTNSRLRRELASKQAEVDALLHEKHTIWEQQAGAAAHYDRELIEGYEQRITQLEGMCERQRRELARWFGKLTEPAAPGWLPGLLEHLKIECEQLRTEVLSRGAAQLASAAQVIELRRRIASLAAGGGKPASPYTPLVPVPVPGPPTDTKENDSTVYPMQVDVKKESQVLKEIKRNSGSDEKDVAKKPVQKPRLTVDDVKKKVSFN